MLDVNQVTPEPPARPYITVPKAELAKWPPDDADLPGGGSGMGAPAGGGFDPGGDGNFKKGRFNPLVILVGVLAIAGLAAFLLIGTKQEEEKLSVEQAEEQKKAIYVLPRAEQLPEWRKWAQTEKSELLREEALKQLAWAKDPQGVDLAIFALKSPSQPIQAMAATALAQYGSPAADKAKDPLLAALKTAGSGAKPQMAWALVVLGESRAFDDVMAIYRLGHLSKVQRLGGGVAFDPELMVRMVPLEKLAALASDASPAVRQLVATVLSRNADPRWTDTLIQLVQDKDPEIARQAAPGLGKIGDERARGPLLSALKTGDKDSRKKYLEALRDGIGAQGLVLALDSVTSEDESRAWFQRKQIFDMLQKLADPRAGDALLKFIETRPNIHWETRAATHMAEVGDVRAVPTLARRLRMDPLKIYSDQSDYEMMLKRDDNERVVAARMLADLAVLYPDKREWIREQAEDAVIFWIHELPSPHANGLRALAAMESRKDLEALRKWANPNTPLPKEGQQPPMPEEWVIAQSALRYVGWLEDKPSWGVLEKALRRRPPELDVTMDGLNQGGVAILGMALRAIGVGAADGFSQWGDPKAFRPLLHYVEDPKNNEQSRMSACAALAWVATKEDVFEVAKKIQEYRSLEKSDQFRRACLLESLIQRPIPGTAPALLALMTPESAVETRHQVARAIGKGGFETEVEKRLIEMTSSDALLNDAALALILGGSPDEAARAVALYANKPKAALEELSDLWFKTFGYWSHEDLEQGRLFKYVDNATAIARLEINKTAQEWATALLMRQFDNLDFDNGPHSFTRVVLRARLQQMAKSDDAAEREGAIRTLKFMKEQGVLLALRDEKGPVGELAQQAYFEIMNPKLLAGGVVAQEQAEDDPQ
ncbi:MAG TPA: HEAT repeat domain-containing protein [Polyangiaceae bacterium]